jgi:hypothetical protein
MGRLPGCDVVGCDEPATGVYLHAADGKGLEFGVCDSHFAQMRGGRRPVIDETPALADLAARPALLLE